VTPVVSVSAETSIAEGGAISHASLILGFFLYFLSSAAEWLASWLCLG
jgi:hypothetical protein